MKKIKCLLILLLFAGSVVVAQKKTITGKVINQVANEPLMGVNILAENQKGGVSTKQDGTYSITVDSKTNALVFSYVGFAAQTVIIGSRATIDILLVPVATTADEVVVIGYGTQKKSNVTGAVSKYQNERLDETPASRLDQALQGKIAGVQIQNISPEAGAEPTVRIRGISSINAGTSPLVVVDGHPVPDGLSFVNMADVLSVEVLKDAASTAIYGSRGGSGVIIITTKSGKANKPKFGIKYSNGFKDVYELYPMMSTTEYTNMLFYEAALKLQDPSITPPTTAQIASVAERGAYIIESQLRGGQGTNWQREAIRTANTRNIQMNVSGGNSGVRYYVSGGYQNDQGQMYHNEYERFTVKTKVDAQLSKKIKLTININPSYIKRERPSTNYIDFVRFQSYMPVYLTQSMVDFIKADPLNQFPNIKAGDFAQARYFNNRVYSGLMPDGSNWVNTSNVTPFNTSNNTPKSVMETRTITSNDYRVLTSGDLNFNILPGLDFKTLGSVYISYNTGLDFAKRNSNRDGDINQGTYSNRTYIDLLSENTLTYSKRIKDHNFNVLAGFTAQKTKINNGEAVGNNYPSDNITTLNTALIVIAPYLDANGNQQGTYNLKNQIGLLSYLGRVIYDYKDKYLLSASIRADGSSYFAPGNKWGYFPSVSLGWVASKEAFLEDANWLSNLKLRTSYGVVGQNRIEPFAFIDQLFGANYPLGAGTGNVGFGQTPSRRILSNPDITWETTFSYNGGVDVSLFKNKISFSLDVYQTKSDKLLLQQAAMSFTGVPLSWTNLGKVKNDGIEFEITTQNIRRKDFKWTTSANIAHVKNNIVELGAEKLLLNQGERTELYMNRVGGPLIQYYGYKTDGVWLSQADITKAQTNGLSSNLANVFVPGGLKLVDVNGDNKIDADDRTVIGNPYPDFTWGITNNLTYKNFDLSFMFQGVQGGSLINGDANYNETKRYNRNYNSNRWISPMFPGDGKTPYSTLGFNWMLTDYVVEDASYYALREILVGYTLPENWAKKAKLNSLRVYFSAQNLFIQTAAGYRGINPEARFTSGNYASPLVTGYQRGSFPMPKTMLFGLDINF